MQYIHEEKAFKCGFCLSNFTDIDIVKKHIKSVTEGKYSNVTFVPKFL